MGLRVYIIGILTLIIALLAYLLHIEKKKVTDPITVTTYVKVPVLSKKFDGFVMPPPIRKINEVLVKREIDSIYYEKYIGLKDSISRDSMYKAAITINEYNLPFEDSVQTINVFAKTRGDLLYLDAAYVLKPFKIRNDTIIDIPSLRRKFNIAIGGSIGIPTNLINPKLGFKAGLDVRFKRKTISIEYDNRAILWTGMKFDVF